MYTPLDTVYILFEAFLYLKMRELFEVADLGGTSYVQTVVLPAVLEGCETWCFSVGEQSAEENIWT
jgi:hypothetical protein